jgi:hypothetical protein
MIQIGVKTEWGEFSVQDVVERSRIILDFPRIPRCENADRSIYPSSPPEAPNLICYKSAIAFPLAARLEQPVEQIAGALVYHLKPGLKQVTDQGTKSGNDAENDWENYGKNLLSPSVAKMWLIPEVDSHIQVWIEPPGWIYWAVLPSGLAIWLQHILRYPPHWSSYTREQKSELLAISRLSWFAVQASYARCCSRLRLAASVGLIDLANPSDRPPLHHPCFPASPFQIKAPEHIPWLDSEQRLRCSASTEQQLLTSLMAMVDLLACQTALSPTQIHKQALALSHSLEQFEADCQILGTVAQRDRPLAMCRVGLWGTAREVLRCVLEDAVEVMAPSEL